MTASRVAHSGRASARSDICHVLWLGKSLYSCILSSHVTRGRGVVRTPRGFPFPAARAPAAAAAAGGPRRARGRRAHGHAAAGARRSFHVTLLLSPLRRGRHK